MASPHAESAESPKAPGFHYDYATPDAWAASLLDHGSELIFDQIHLEKKAAAAAVTFSFRVPLELRWQRGLSRLAREELVHFERAMKLATARGLSLQAQEPTQYASRLKKGAAGGMPERFVDELLVGAIIEGRSCERMSMLASAFAERDPELARFYGDLIESEKRHEALYLDIACALAPQDAVERRWRRMVQHEAEVLRALPWSPRLHGGEPGQ